MLNKLKSAFFDVTRWRKSTMLLHRQKAKLGLAKVKLIAIARNEAAYLSEWIFHHLYFGFDAIEVYVNNTDDNTFEIIEHLQDLPNVFFRDGDVYFSSNKGSPQVKIYKHAMVEANKQGFTHVMFLDIDEFWTPKDFGGDIQSVLKTVNSDVICFEWQNKIENESLFAPAIEAQMQLQRATQVKSVISSALPPQISNAHNVKVAYAKYKLADGSAFEPATRAHSKLKMEVTKQPIKPYFILHRLNRGVDEYLSLIGRPNPLELYNADDFSFKTNRNGLVSIKKTVKFKFDENTLEQYFVEREMFYEKYDLREPIKTGQNHILRMRDLTLEKIAQAPIDKIEDIKRVLRLVNSPKAKKAYRMFLKRHNLRD